MTTIINKKGGVNKMKNCFNFLWGIILGFIGGVLFFLFLEKGQDTSIYAEWFSAIGTVGAVVVVLWQIRNEKTERIYGEIKRNRPMFSVSTGKYIWKDSSKISRIVIEDKYKKPLTGELKVRGIRITNTSPVMVPELLLYVESCTDKNTEDKEAYFRLKDILPGETVFFVGSYSLQTKENVYPRLKSILMQYKTISNEKIFKQTKPNELIVFSSKTKKLQDEYLYGNSVIDEKKYQDFEECFKRHSKFITNVIRN